MAPPIISEIRRPKGKHHIGRGRFLTVSSYHGEVRISLRQYSRSCDNKGQVKWFPSHPGISLHENQFMTLVENKDIVHQKAQEFEPFILDLEQMRFVSVHSRNGTIYITLREWTVDQSGKPLKPLETSGIALNFMEFDAAYRNFEEALIEVKRIKDQLELARAESVAATQDENKWVFESEIAVLTENAKVNQITPDIQIPSQVHTEKNEDQKLRRKRRIEICSSDQVAKRLNFDDDQTDPDASIMHPSASALFENESEECCYPQAVHAG